MYMANAGSSMHSVMHVDNLTGIDTQGFALEHRQARGVVKDDSPAILTRLS